MCKHERAVRVLQELIQLSAVFLGHLVVVTADLRQPAIFAYCKVTNSVLECIWPCNCDARRRVLCRMPQV
jgi:hypothetical protein